MGYKIPDFTPNPRQAYEAVLLENRQRSRTVPEVGAMALEVCMPGGLRRGQDLLGALFIAYEATLNEVEADGRQRARRGAELAYHNRQHVADCLLALACLLRLDESLPDVFKVIGLLVMAGHDLGHQGLENDALGGDSAQERLTAARLAEGAWRSLPPETLKLATELVIGTDPALVPKNHADHRLADVFNHRALLQVYINEADIAASLLPELGRELTRALLQERGEMAPVSEAIDHAYRNFRLHACVSSAAGRALIG